jgi:hypothetical protein
MKHLSTIVGLVGIAAVTGPIALLHPHKANAEAEWIHKGTSYLTTVKDSTGNFASRGVITLHADHTISVIDSGQGGPSFSFTSQLGSWRANGNEIVARTIDFDFPPNADTARLDYTIHFDDAGKRTTGTITLISFPLEGNPLDGGGTIVGAFTFEGELVTP